MNQRKINRLILDNLKLVKMIALKIARRIPPGIEVDDLIHSGIIGLIDAATKYRSERGTKFESYASLRIKGAIIDELRNYDWATRSLRKKIKMIEVKYWELKIKLEREPHEEEIAKSMGMSVLEYRKFLLESKAVTIGVFRYYTDSEENFSSDQRIQYIYDESNNTPLFIMEKKQLVNILSGLIKGLTKRDKLVLNLYYLEDLNLKEIAQVLELTESRISQIRAEAIIKLRAKIKELAKKDRVEDIQYIGG